MVLLRRRSIAFNCFSWAHTPATPMPLCSPSRAQADHIPVHLRHACAYLRTPAHATDLCTRPSTQTPSHPCTCLSSTPTPAPTSHPWPSYAHSVLPTEFLSPDTGPPCPAPLFTCACVCARTHTHKHTRPPHARPLHTHTRAHTRTHTHAATRLLDDLACFSALGLQNSGLSGTLLPGH